MNVFISIHKKEKKKKKTSSDQWKKYSIALLTGKKPDRLGQAVKERDGDSHGKQALHPLIFVFLWG